MFEISANRRELLIAPLLATMPTALLRDCADASPIEPAMTFTKLPDQITLEAAPAGPKTCGMPGKLLELSRSALSCEHSRRRAQS